MNRKARRLSALILSAALLAACSGNLREVLGEPPQVSIDGLERVADEVILGLAIRNVNDQALDLDAVSVTVTLDGRALAAGERVLALTISPRGRESLHLTLAADPAGLERLESLAAGEVQRLPWTLEADLALSNSRDRETEAEGWLYRVPGQPNRFR